MAGQTDTTIKSCWWFVTINNYSDEELRLLKTQHKLFKSSRGVLEIGGEKKVPHVHCLLNTDHTRASAIKQIFPRAHIDAKFRGTKDDSVQTTLDYIEGKSTKKIIEDTAVEGSRWFIQFRGEAHLSFGDSLKRLAEYAWDLPTCNQRMAKLLTQSAKYTTKDVYKEEYDHCVANVIMEDLNLLALYSQTQYKNSWVSWRTQIIQHYQTDSQTSITFSPADSIADAAHTQESHTV